MLRVVLAPVSTLAGAFRYPLTRPWSIAMRLRIVGCAIAGPIRQGETDVPGKTALRLTKRSVETLAAEGRDSVFRDSDLPGFGVRVYRTGRRVYCVQTPGAGRAEARHPRTAWRNHCRCGPPPGGGRHRPHQARRGPVSGCAGARTDGRRPGRAVPARMSRSTAAPIRRTASA